MVTRRKTLEELQLTSFDRVILVVNNLLLGVALLIFLFPLLNVVSNSLSAGRPVLTGKVILLPIEPTLEHYAAVLTESKILQGYLNSGFYTVFGTMINIALTIMIAYPLSLAHLKGRSLITFLLTFTMFFGGGMIPTFLLVRGLGLVDTRLALLIPQAMNVFYVIMARTYFQSSIPQELYDCSALDGANDFQILRHVVVPLATPIIAVLILYYAVDHWNRFFDGLIYLNRAELYPLQLVIREYVFRALVEVESETEEAFSVLADMEVQKYALIVLGSLPVIILYPFIQRFFTKGIMIGSLKG